MNYMDLRNKTFDNYDTVLGAGAMIPFNASNSGARKILAETQKEQSIQLIHGETPFITTGVEQQYGEYSSSIITAKANLTLIAKIPKFSKNPDHCYYNIFINEDNKTIEMVLRIGHKPISETYGYRINNSYLDNLKVGDLVRKNTILRKSTSYDEYNNRKDCVNAIVAYMNLGDNMEDGVIISKSFALKGASPLYHKVPVIINGNDIPLNLFGKDDKYKVMPDVGCEITNGILLALRKENKSNALFAQDWNRLKDIMMSDIKYTTNGRVVDLDIHCNNPDEIRDNPYYGQLMEYWDDSMLFAKNFVEVVDELIAGGYTPSYDISVILSDCKKQLSGTQYIKDKVFSNINMEIMVEEISPIEVGDKIANRYGGKGVVVLILDDDKMPMLENGKRVEVIMNFGGVNNRVNPGQLFESEYNHRSQRIIEYMRTGLLSSRECADLFCDYISYIAKDLSEYYAKYFKSLDDQSLDMFIDNLKSYDGIHLSVRPMLEGGNIDALAKLDKAYPWAANKYKVYTYLPDSNGNPRMVEAYNDIICGTEAIQRLKQYAEEKFSATSLSATNIRRENTRSKDNKMYKGIHTKTPIKFGDMEIGNMGNIGNDIVSIMLMTYSLSPESRIISGEQQLLGDPYNIDVKLDRESSNIKVEIINTKLKTIGLRLVFKKTPKVRKIGFYQTFEPIPRYGFKLYKGEAQSTLKKLWEHTHNEDGTPKKVQGFVRYGFNYHPEGLKDTSDE